MATKLCRRKTPAIFFALFLCLHRFVPTPVVGDDDQIPADLGLLDDWLSDYFDELAIYRDIYERRKVIKVEKDGSGDFRTVQDAVNSIPSGSTKRTVVKIGPGVYREKVVVDRSRPYVTFAGNRRAMPTITFNGTAARYGTWESATFAVESHYFVASNIIFKNAAKKPASDGRRGDQAVAMRISGDKAAFFNCRFYGYQDTLCDDKGKHFFKDCYIRGTVDFIFGNGRSLYMNCEIESVADGFAVITAQGRSEISDRSGFSFVHCKINGTGSAYLGRAWRKRSRAIFSYTYMDALINPKGWDNKGFSDRNRTVFFGEYKCKGPGSASGKRVSYTRALTGQQAKPYLSMTFIKARTWLLPAPDV